MSWCHGCACSSMISPPLRSVADERTTRNGSSAAVRRFLDIYCQNIVIAADRPAGDIVPAMTANLASFAIHVDDVDRARKFYEAVFGWVLEPWGPPGFYLIHTGDDTSPGIQGLMHKRQVPRTGTGLNGFEPSFAVDDVDTIAA